MEQAEDVTLCSLPKVRGFFFRRLNNEDARILGSRRVSPRFSRLVAWVGFRLGLWRFCSVDKGCLEGWLAVCRGFMCFYQITKA